MRVMKNTRCDDIDTLLGNTDQARRTMDSELARIEAELALAEAAMARGETLEQFLASRGGK